MWGGGLGECVYVCVVGGGYSGGGVMLCCCVVFLPIRALGEGGSWEWLCAAYALWSREETVRLMFGVIWRRWDLVVRWCCVVNLCACFMATLESVMRM